METSSANMRERRVDSLRIEYIEVIGEAAFIPVAYDAIGFFGGVRGFLGLVQATAERLLAHGDVGDILQGLRDGAVVIGDGFIVAGAGRTELSAQTAALKNRQRDGRAEAADARSRLRQQIGAQRLEAEV